MIARNFLGVCLFFLSSVGESLSLKLPPQARASSHLYRPAKAIGVETPHLFDLRGGQQQEEQIDLDMEEQASSPTPAGKPIMSALDTSCLSGALAMVGQFYSSSLESFPILTKSVTACVLFAVSDQMAQMLEMRRNLSKEQQPKSLLAATSKKRSLYSGLVGFLYFGPMAHLWYGWIFKNFPGKSMLSILHKAALGQFIFAPPLFCVFFATALIQNGQFTMGNWIRKIKQDLIKGWLGGLGFWPFCNYISYAYVPEKFIPLFINVMGLVFNIYVSLIANLKQKEKTS